ncbi:MAG TPA: redoxin domain-containing protein [Flavobacterium sp.]|nr:redoxin domain-containing protein [Flavobacterium sp.]
MKKILFIFLLSLIMISCNSAAKEETVPPPKPLKTYSKGSVSVDSYNYSGFENFLKKENDTVYVVNFWATWCQPCVQELPNFEKLEQEHKEDKVKVLLVSIDFPKTAESKLLPFIEKRNLKPEVILLDDPDANSWINKVDSSWSGAIPATLIYTKERRIFYEKSFTFDELERETKKFL